MKRPVLTLLWICLVIWCEIGVFLFSTSRCSWPWPSNSGRSGEFKHVLVLADPQILGARSYPDRLPWLRALSQFIVDLNLRKNWRAAIRLKPDIIVVLGDMMDGGREDISDEEYDSYFNRFRGIFKFSDSLLPANIYYVPGNHDVGLGKSLPVSSHARDRFYAHFGPFNQVVKVTDTHSLVIVDSPGLLDEDEERVSYGLSLEQWSTFGGAIDFVRSVPASQDGESRKCILFTHIPLSRPSNAECGSLRERGVIRPGKGAGYQNTLSEELSGFLLNNIKPVLVLSGDDHDYCEYSHADNTREVTVKSISMAMGIRRPGFQLISIPEGDNDGYADRPCHLPDQVGIYLTVYLPCVVITLMILFFGPLYQSSEDVFPMLPLPIEERGFRGDNNSAATWVCLRRRRGLGRSRLRRLVTDFEDVAWPPITVFFVVTCYTMFLT